MIAPVPIPRELVLTARPPTDALAAWLRDVEAGAALLDPGERTFLVVTPLGFAHRERLLARLEAGGVPVERRTAIPDWPRIDTALRVPRAPRARLRRAARFEAVWQSLFPATPGEAWAIGHGAHARAVALKRSLRDELPGLRVDLGDGAPVPGVLHAFHLADLLDARAEARRLLAALALLAERRRGPRRRLEDLLLQGGTTSGPGPFDRPRRGSGSARRTPARPAPSHERPSHLRPASA